MKGLQMLHDKPANTKTPMKPEFEDTCPACSDGTMIYVAESDCTCHIAPPCEACVSAPLVCGTCGFNADTDWADFKDTLALRSDVWRLRPHCDEPE